MTATGLLRRSAALVFLGLAAGLPAGTADGQAQRAPYEPTASETATLDGRMQELERKLDSLPRDGREDAEVFLHVARMARSQRLFPNSRAVADVLRGLELGLARCESLSRGERPWRRAVRSLRGFRSRVDGSVQPYVVALPAGYDPAAAGPVRLDVVLHGRGPTEVTFLQMGEPANPRPTDGPFVELHPFGRGNNGWRWAGETDVFEALEQARREFRVDPDRVVLRGFSMGGHGAWHIGLHHPGEWAAVSPGAGFSETRRYLRIAGDVPPLTEKLWRIYDAVDYAANLASVPVIAYGGEKDPQLQAARNVQDAAAALGLSLRVEVGPDTEHRYHPQSLQRIMAFLAGQKRPADRSEVRFTTWTLKYPRMAWVRIDGLEEHYRRAEVHARHDGALVEVRTSNTTGLTLDPLPAGTARLLVDGTPLPVSGKAVRLERTGGRWRTARGEPAANRKRPGVQGPLDDALTGPFLLVRGTGTPWSAAAGRLASERLERFREEWRFGFRGEAPVRDDTAVTEEELRSHNVVLFGDPGSNSVLARWLSRLPLRWRREGVRLPAGEPETADALPVLIQPNPLNPQRYVVLNSGHTFGRRELDASNATLYPRLGDWALLSTADGSVLRTGLCDEGWKPQPVNAAGAAPRPGGPARGRSAGPSPR